MPRAGCAAGSARMTRRAARRPAASGASPVARPEARVEAPGERVERPGAHHFDRRYPLIADAIRTHMAAAATASPPLKTAE